jgi:putative FmdB family regulatory protein
MPIYEYLCRDCDKAFELYVKAWGEPVSCAACASANVEKRLSTFAMAGGASSANPMPRGGGGACCGGGGCGCH